jgi:hypothetical protein
MTLSAAHIVSGATIVCGVIRGKPFTLRIASICSSGNDAKDRLANARRVQRDAAAELHQNAHHLVALDLRDEHRLGAIKDREVRRLAGLLHQPAHVDVALRNEIAIGEKSGADGERMQADVPEAKIAPLVHIAHSLQRGEQPMRRRWRQIDAVGEVR